MKAKEMSLPYPVLGIQDDITPLLTKEAVTITITEDKGNYHVDIDLEFTNDEIEELINKGKANYACECACTKTFYRECYRSNTPRFDITIPCNHVCGRIFFYCRVVVTQPINAYHNEGFHDDYADVTFDMEAGDLLVVFPDAWYDTDLKYEKLQAAGSFMCINKNPDEKEENTRFDLNKDIIEILLPPPLFEMYNTPSVNNAAVVLHSSLVLNALTYALIELSRQPDKYEQYLWARAITYRINDEKELKDYKDLENCDTQDVLELAQKLLKNPYQRLFNTLAEDENTMED